MATEHRDPHAHCGRCGARFHAGVSWPRTCTDCHQVTYRNPLPVAVLVVPIDAGVLVVRRGIPPAVGALALPGGYITAGETWQAAAVRELMEETGIPVDAMEVRHLETVSTDDDFLLVVGRTAPRSRAVLGDFTPNHEVTGVEVVDRPVTLAFPVHTRVLADYLAGR